MPKNTRGFLHSASWPGSAPPWCCLIDEMLIKLFVLQNEPMGHSLFLVNFKQAGLSEFVLTLLTPDAFCLYQTLFLSFQNWNRFSFSCFLIFC